MEYLIDQLKWILTYNIRFDILTTYIAETLRPRAGRARINTHTMTVGSH